MTHWPLLANLTCTSTDLSPPKVCWLTTQLLILFSLSLLGCSDQTAIGKINDNGFIYCGRAAPVSFNPQLTRSDITSKTLSPQLFDTLLTLDANTFQPLPNIASSWTLNESGTEYLFTLHPVSYTHLTLPTIA